MKQLETIGDISEEGNEGLIPILSIGAMPNGSRLLIRSNKVTDANSMRKMCAYELEVVRELRVSGLARLGYRLNRVTSAGAKGGIQLYIEKE